MQPWGFRCNDSRQSEYGGLNVAKSGRFGPTFLHAAVPKDAVKPSRLDEPSRRYRPLLTSTPYKLCVTRSAEVRQKRRTDRVF